MLPITRGEVSVTVGKGLCWISGENFINQVRGDGVLRISSSVKRQNAGNWALDFHSAHPIGRAESISGIGLCMCVCPSSLRRWSLFLLVRFRDPYNHTYSESLWWKLFKNNKRTQIQRQRQWQRQRQRQRHRESAWKTQHMLHFWNPDDLLIPNMMIDTLPCSSCSRQSPWLHCSGHTISSTGPSVSPFRDFCMKFWFH